MRIYIRVIGKKSKTTNMGSFTLRLNATIETTFEGNRFLLKPFWYLYSYLFYNKMRRNFLKRCRTMLEVFRDELKKYYNLKVYTKPEREGTYG